MEGYWVDYSDVRLSNLSLPFSSLFFCIGPCLRPSVIKSALLLETGETSAAMRSCKKVRKSGTFLSRTNMTSSRDGGQTRTLISMLSNTKKGF